MTADEFRARFSGPEAELPYIHEDDQHVIKNAVAQLKLGKSQVMEYRSLRPGGQIRYIREIVEPVLDETGKVVRDVGTSMDLTELRLAEIRSRQSQRLEAVGTLTGGVAHDFNNLLAIILGNLELTLEIGRAEDWKDLIGSAITATKRGADLTKNLLSFSRRAHLEPKRLNLNKTIQSTISWASRVLPETIDVESSLMAGIWDVELDVASVENAIINILLNARDAMPNGGRLTIETANMRIGEEYVTQRAEDIMPGRYVMLAISDTGHGIAPGKIDNIFEPFYTDKPVGQGSGLGLSMVHGFIKQSGGTIRVYSEVGVGTTFKLYFKAATPSETKLVDESYEAPHRTNNSGEILVVEDEEGVMDILKRVLATAGYGVTTAASGDEALQKFKSSRPFDLLLTDVVMPGKLQGPMLAKAIRALDPNIPCIFMSGYANEATVHGNGLKPSDIRLMKPVGRSDLLDAVSKAMNSRQKNT